MSCPVGSLGTFGGVYERAGRIGSALERRLENARIDAVIRVVPDPEVADVVELSGDAALVYIPLRVQGMRLADAFGFGIDATLAGLPVVALVAASQDVELSESEPTAEPEIGSAEDAAARDARLNKATKRCTRSTRVTHALPRSEKAASPASSFRSW